MHSYTLDQSAQTIPKNIKSRTKKHSAYQTGAINCHYVLKKINK